MTKNGTPSDPPDPNTVSTEPPPPSETSICLNDQGTCTWCGHGCPCACRGCPGCSAPNPPLPDLDSAPVEAAPVNNPVFCSFCGKNQEQVLALVSGPAVLICTECLEFAVDTLATQFGIPSEALYGYLKGRRMAGVEAYLERMAAAVTAMGGPVVIGPPK